MRVIRILAVLAIAATFGPAAGCGGDDDDEDTVATEATTTEETTEASAGRVTVTTSDTADGYTWDVSPTPTAETTSVTLQNKSEEDHALVFARLGEGYTVDEAYELEGRKGSATEVIQTTGARPEQSATAKVIKPLDPGEYVLLCPVAGKVGPHYKLGQLAEFAIEQRKAMEAAGLSEQAMSEENVEIVRRSAEEFNRGGVEAVIDTYWAPEIVWDMTNTGVPDIGVYTGYDEVRAFMADWFSVFEFDEWELEVEELLDAGDTVVSMVRQRGRGTSSGAEVGVEFAQIVTLRAGKIVRVDNYLDRNRALEAAGLSE